MSSSVKIEAKNVHPLHGNRVTRDGTLIGYVRTFEDVSHNMSDAGGYSIGTTRRKMYCATTVFGKTIGNAVRRMDAIAMIVRAAI